MHYQFLASGLVILHFLFVGFVIIGGVFCFKWQKMIWVHLPAVAWSITIECSGWICPLTPLENYFRLKAGASAYNVDFISYYLLPILYPASLTRNIQYLLGFAVLLVNVLVYGILFRVHRQQKKNHCP
ncbi:DUF2784 domain-containing protein [bacterium]|nr:DUF2784 domain-containing protein [bacterium]